jgi:hypothetical protein
MGLGLLTKFPLSHRGLKSVSLCGNSASNRGVRRICGRHVIRRDPSHHRAT